MAAVYGFTSMPWFTAGLRPLGGAGPLLILSRDDVTSCLRRLDAVEIVRSVLIDHDAGATVLPPEAYLRWDNTQGAYTRSIAMPGGVVRDGRALYGLKVINASVSNPAVGLERAAGQNVDQIISAYPYMDPADIEQALRYAAWRVEEKEPPLPL